MNITIKEINREKALGDIKNKYLTKLRAITEEEKVFYKEERKQNLITLSWVLPLFVFVSAVICIVFLKSNLVMTKALLIIFELALCMIFVGFFMTDRPIHSQKYIDSEHKEKSDICKKIEDECELSDLISIVRQHNRHWRQTNFGDILLPFLFDLETFADYLKILDSNILSVELGEKEHILNFTYADAEGLVHQHHVSCARVSSIKETETSLSFALTDGDAYSGVTARIILTCPYEKQENT